jgi:hypothetical protein
MISDLQRALSEKKIEANQMFEIISDIQSAISRMRSRRRQC